MRLCRTCRLPSAIGYDAITDRPLDERQLPICECAEPRWAEAGFDAAKQRLIVLDVAPLMEEPEAEPEQMAIGAAA